MVKNWKPSTGSTIGYWFNKLEYIHTVDIIYRIKIVAVDLYLFTIEECHVIVSEENGLQNRTSNLTLILKIHA